MTSIIISKRYRGPPNSGNGGYVCGRLARHIAGGAEVTLRAPPPLDKPLDAGGLALSRYSASASLLILIVACILFFPQRAASRSH